MNPVLLGLLGFGLLRVSNSQVRAFERYAALDISNKLTGPEKHVEIRSRVGPEAIFGDINGVTISGDHFSANGLPLYVEPKRSHRGVLRHLDLEFRNIFLKGLHIESLEASIPDSRFDLSLAMREHRFRLTRSGTGHVEVKVSDVDLAHFILSKYSEIKSVRVKIDRDQIEIEGHAEILLLTTDFVVISKLEAVDGKRLTLTHSKILFDGQIASNEAANVLLQILNPVVDLDRDLGLDGAVSLNELELRAGILAARGTTKIPPTKES